MADIFETPPQKKKKKVSKNASRICRNKRHVQCGNMERGHVKKCNDKLHMHLVILFFIVGHMVHGTKLKHL